jgi:hypothetical protein
MSQADRRNRTGTDRLTFGVSQARPFWAMVDTLENVRPKVAILENVEGLERRYINHEGHAMSCLDCVMDTWGASTCGSRTLNTHIPQIGSEIEVREGWVDDTGVESERSRFGRGRRRSGPHSSRSHPALSGTPFPTSIHRDHSKRVWHNPRARGHPRNPCREEFVLHTIRTRCAGYIVVVVPPSMTDPVAFGGFIHRPREYILVFRRDVYPSLTDEGAVATVKSLVARLAAACVSAKPAGCSFLDVLKHSPPSVGQYIPCGCTLMRDCGNPHSCTCLLCRADRIDKCSWRRRHRAAWEDVGGVDAKYFRHMGAMGIDASADLTTPRQRDLTNLCVASHSRGNLDAIADGVFDTSASFGFNQWRNDGTLPTLGTRSRIFACSLGRHINIVDLYRLMGFPPVYDVASRPLGASMRLLGNTMHVSTIGVMLAVVMSLRS